MIRRRYPGLRKPFSLAYKTFLERDFFGIGGLDGNTSHLNLIDRINLHCKCGSHINVDFTNEELSYLKMVESVETWEDVVDVTKKLWQYVKDNEQDKPQNSDELNEFIKESIKHQKKEKNPQDQDDDSDDSEDIENNPTESESDDENDSGESDDDSEEESDDENDSGESNDDSEEESENSKNNAGAGSKGNDNNDEPDSITDNAFRNREDELVDEKAKPYIYMDMPICDLKKIIVPGEIVIDKFERAYTKAMRDHRIPYNHPAWKSALSHTGVDYNAMAVSLQAVFNRRHLPYVNLLVKEFEMRKNAKQYARQLQSRTGELDTRRLSQYRHTSDLFRKVTTVEKGKSHGMIMFVDMSGSMAGNVMRDTIEQTLILVTFCRKVGIPFEVYGFNDYPCSYLDKNLSSVKFKANTKTAFNLSNDCFHLKTLISSEMNTRTLRRAMNMLLIFGNFSMLDPDDKEIYDISLGLNMQYSHENAGMSLNGTPFIETIVASRSMIPAFQNKTHVDIVNVIYLTDGEGNNSVEFPNIFSKYGGYQEQNVHIGFVDPITKKRVLVNKKAFGNLHQAALTELVREATGCRHIGMFVGSSATISQRLTYIKGPDKSAEKDCLNKNNYFKAPAHGYDSYYYIVSKEKSSIESFNKDELFALKKQFTKNELQKEFSNFLNSKKKNRALITAFATEIST